eukprot:1847512-Amphidinium_carterae.1
MLVSISTMRNQRKVRGKGKYVQKTISQNKSQSVLSNFGCCLSSSNSNNNNNNNNNNNMERYVSAQNGKCAGLGRPQNAEKISMTQGENSHGSRAGQYQGTQWSPDQCSQTQRQGLPPSKVQRSPQPVQAMGR